MVGTTAPIGSLAGCMRRADFSGPAENRAGAACRKRPFRGLAPSACLPFQARGKAPERPFATGARSPFRAVVPNIASPVVRLTGDRAKEKGALRAPCSGINNLPRWTGGAGGVRPRPPGKFRRVHVAGVAGGVHPRATSAKPLDGFETTSDAAVRQTKFHQSMNDLSSPSGVWSHAGTWNCSIDHATSARTSERSKSPRRATR